MDSGANSSKSIRPTIPTLPTLPPGYSYLESNGISFAVPNYLIPATNYVIDVFNTKNKINTDENIPIVRFLFLFIIFIHRAVPLFRRYRSLPKNMD
jgi:hypothetical protein